MYKVKEEFTLYARKYTIGQEIANRKFPNATMKELENSGKIEKVIETTAIDVPETLGDRNDNPEQHKERSGSDNAK